MARWIQIYFLSQKEGYCTKGTGEISRKDLVAIKIDRHFSSRLCVLNRNWVTKSMCFEVSLFFTLVCVV